MTLEQKIEAWIVFTTLGGIATWWLSRGVETLERAPEWDGHTSADVLQRLRRSFSGNEGE